LQSGDVTLIGVADPLAKAGDAPASVPARLGAQGIDPAPKLGFAGAAAVDTRGRVVGMVDLRPPVVAGSGGAAGQAAALVPVEAIRAFLQARRVAPAAATSGSINQAVLRVVCVRK
jgi:hypothetical protein